MTEDQLNVLNITQEVMRGVAIAFIAAAPEKAGAFASALQAASAHPDLSPMAAAMLDDLAIGASMLASAGQPRC